MSVTLRQAQQPLRPRLGNRRIEQATVADHPAVIPAQHLGIVRRQTLLPAEHRQRTTTPHERILDIRKHDDARAFQRSKRRHQVNTSHPLKTRESWRNIAATVINKMRAQCLQHAGATIVGGATAQANI